MQETWVRSLGWDDPLEKERLHTPVFWPGEFHWLYSPWGHKESDTTERLSLSHFMQDPSSLTRDQIPALAARSFNHWTIRELPWRHFRDEEVRQKRHLASCFLRPGNGFSHLTSGLDVTMRLRNSGMREFDHLETWALIIGKQEYAHWNPQGFLKDMARK